MATRQVWHRPSVRKGTAEQRAATLLQYNSILVFYLMWGFGPGRSTSGGRGSWAWLGSAAPVGPMGPAYQLACRHARLLYDASTRRRQRR